MGLSDNHSRHFNREQYLWLSDKYPWKISIHRTYYCWNWTAYEHSSWDKCCSFLAFLLETSSGTRTHNIRSYFKVHTVVFIPITQGIFLLDSHPYGNSRAHVTHAEWQHSFELLSWFKKINNFQSTLGKVTNVKFH